MTEKSSNSVDWPIIRPINRGVVHKICAGQVIYDLSSAVKELVENSLDAGATSIEIALKEYGEEWFQVIDNGCGISPQNFMVLALKHHTSKLADFPDLQSLSTFGFRGEALSSLCALGNLSLTTRTKNESFATHLTFDHSGLLIAEKKTARQIGTTVIVNKLFSNLPVRSKEFSRNIRKEYSKLISLLNAYAVISKGVRFLCSNTSGRNVKSVVLTTEGRGSLKDNIISVFGMSNFSCLDPLKVAISKDCEVEGFLSKPGYGNGRNLGDRQFFYVNGRPVDMPKVSKLVNELYKGGNSRQYPIVILNFILPMVACDVNVTPDKRKTFLSDESSILQSLRCALEKTYCPISVSFSLNNEKSDKTDDGPSLPSLGSKPLPQQSSHKAARSQSDVVYNEELGKEEVLSDIVHCSHLDELHVAKKFHDHGARFSRKDFSLKIHGFKKSYTYDGLPDDRVCSTVDIPQQSCKESQDIGAKISLNRSSTLQSSLTNFVTLQKRKYENLGTTLSEVPILRNESVHRQMEDQKSDPDYNALVSPVIYYSAVDSAETDVNEQSKHFKIDHDFEEGNVVHTTTANADLRIEEMIKLNNGTASDTTGANSLLRGLEKGSLGVSAAAPPRQDVPPVSSAVETYFTLQFNVEELVRRRRQKLSRLKLRSDTCSGVSTRCYSAASLELSQMGVAELKERVLAAATMELQRIFRKDDFRRMQVIGQFNLGFIIAKVDQELFIVDQHAADEKYNYEHLSQSTILNQQPLLRPLNLELSPEEEEVASMNMDIIRQNGFSLQEDMHAPPGRRFKLKVVPFSKNIMFGVEDVKELISIIADGQGECSIMCTYKKDSADSICPSRVRDMLASRACRSSVMIGDALGRNEMQKIVDHLAELKSPWNCPHGRPTMRHLIHLEPVH
ncbi:hypothetical protein Dimus_016158 [Dionaea muscipula]